MFSNLFIYKMAQAWLVSCVFTMFIAEKAFAAVAAFAATRNFRRRSGRSSFCFNNPPPRLVTAEVALLAPGECSGEQGGDRNTCGPGEEKEEDVDIETKMFCCWRNFHHARLIQDSKDHQIDIDSTLSNRLWDLWDWSSGISYKVV